MSNTVITGLVPVISIFRAQHFNYRDGRNKSGHDKKIRVRDLLKRPCTIGKTPLQNKTSLRAKRSNPDGYKNEAGLLRRFAPRNDDHDGCHSAPDVVCRMASWHIA